MIDEKIYRDEWTLLCERFRMTGDKEPSAEMMRRYYNHLTRHLDTETFQRQCERIYVENRFFPDPPDFIPARSADVRAVEQWEQVNKLLRNAASPLDSLDEPARRAVYAMGGLGRIGSDVDTLDFRRKDFMEFYVQFSESIKVNGMGPMLPGGSKLIRGAMDGLGPDELKELQG